MRMNPWSFNIARGSSSIPDLHRLLRRSPRKPAKSPAGHDLYAAQPSATYRNGVPRIVNRGQLLRNSVHCAEEPAEATLLEGAAFAADQALPAAILIPRLAYAVRPGGVVQPLHETYPVKAAIHYEDVRDPDFALGLLDMTVTRLSFRPVERSMPCAV